VIAPSQPLHPEIRAWLERGLPVRANEEDPWAGRCGAEVVRKASATYCRYAAGRGTRHKGMGRCSDHEGSESGLPIWIGNVSPEAWQRITGATVIGPGQGVGREVTHNATELVNADIRSMFGKLLDEEERLWFDSVPKDPVDLLDLVIQLRVVALGRVNRAMQQLRHEYASSGRRAPYDRTVTMEAMADKISQTIARLQESRAKYLELESQNDHREGLRDILRGLSDEEFAAVSSQPHLLHSLGNRG
jgi:hypothetical protein